MENTYVLDARPPQDEYSTEHEPPPAYDNFDDAYVQWCAIHEAKLAIIHVQDPAVAATEKELKEAKEVLKDMKEKR
jgi:hypothetical protein